LKPHMHPFAKARERMRALNAVKMERMFAKPFVAALEGHVEGVERITRMPGSLNTVASAGWDGEILLHDLPKREVFLKLLNAHQGKVSGLCFADQERLLSCGVDRNVKLWDVRRSSSSSDVDAGFNGESGPILDTTEKRESLSIYPGKNAFNDIDHHSVDPLFATASNMVHVWDETKSAPITNLTFSTSTETVSRIRFNPSEPSILATIGSDRTFTLYDIRTSKAERRVIMQMRSNDLSWCPTFPTSILLASEDHNLYTFDIRRLESPSQIYKGHVAAVMACEWAPTGVEFVSGGWDRTVRLWKEGVGKSRDVYHTKRMQRVFSTTYTHDARFVLSGSDDGNVRLWKARADEKLGVIDNREKAAMEYRDELKRKWKHDSEVGRIARKRHLPKSVHATSKLHHTITEAGRVKEERRRKHTRAGDSKPKAERRKVVLAEQS